MHKYQKRRSAGLVGSWARRCEDKQFAVPSIANGHIADHIADRSVVLPTPLTYEQHEKGLKWDGYAPGGAPG